MSLLNTRMQNLRGEANFDKYENRPSRYGAFDLFRNQTDSVGSIITPELKEKAFSGIGNVLQTSVIDYDGGISIGSSRTATIADSENTSQLVTISFTTYAFGFTIVPAMYSNNQISMQNDFNTKMVKYLNLLGSTIDTAAAASLNTGKTLVLGNSLNYTVSGNTVIARWDKREELIGDLNVMMGANDYYDDLQVVANSGIESVVKKLQQHGISNDQNKQLEYNDKLWYWSNRITNPANKYGVGYIVNGGSVGMLTRVERESTLRTTTADGHAWDIETLPMLNIPVGTYFYESVGDWNAIAGAATADLTRAKKQHFGFAVDIALVRAYNSNTATIPSPIIKFAIERNMDS